MLLLILCLSSALAADDTTVLLTLKAATSDPFQVLKSWNTSTDPCQWNGVSCSPRGQVSSLSLLLVEFPAPALASAIQELSGLHTLSVSRSNFTVPLENVTLPSCHLELLSISSNQLAGSIPSNLLTECKRLRRLDLSHNQLTGTLPSALFQTCARLVSLDFSSNELSGTVPREMLVNCGRLREVSLAYNNFSGEFPAVDSQSNIRKLKLASNSFTRLSITCSKLVELDVSCNELAGEVFTPTASACLSLKFLNISNNSFLGSFSNTFAIESFLPSLVLLDASHNHFTGQVPNLHAELQFLNLSSNNFSTMGNNLCSGDGRTSKLRSLLIPKNKLAGPVLRSVLNCTSLEMLDLSFNSISGEVPQDLCNKLPSLQHLLLWVNDLQGGLPLSFRDCMNLSTVLLSYNRLQGNIPPDISLAKNLWWLSLSNNELNGTVPSTLGRLTNLTLLQLGNNSLEGKIPAELANCKNLLMLDLSGNLLSGPVPAKVGRDFTGPVNLGQAPVVNNMLGNSRLVEVQFSKCEGRDGVFLLQGIPLEVFEELLNEMVPECRWTMLIVPAGTATFTSILTLTLSYNRLTGHIPPGISHMQSLLKLDLAHNLLDGPLPDELGDLRNIQVLDLSENTLRGRIPDSMALLTFIFSFNVSYNNLSGLIPQKGQFSTFTASSFEGNPGLYGFPLADKQDDEVQGGQLEDDEDDAGKVEQVVVGIAFSVVAFLVSCGVVLFWNNGNWKKRPVSL